MEKVVNEVCSIVISDNYKNFTSSIYEFNGKDIEHENLNISEVYDEILILTDENVYNHQLENFINSINVKMIYEYIVSAGEDSKSLLIYEDIIKYCTKINLSRKSLIIALGGGVIGDLAGFIASTYMRGIDVCQIPTSLLAQVDSSVGGKTGINIGNLKNIIGTFYQPKFTYININALQTLPENEFISGMAEVIKYGVIYDYKLLHYIIENSEKILDKDNEVLNYIIKRSIEIKAGIVSKDEKEGGLRKILNFGHTFGHGIEKICKISHGEAVSIGMHMAFKLSLKKGYIDEDYYNQFIKACNKFNLPLMFNPFLYEEEITEDKKDNINKEILEVMKNDKKNSFGNLNLILPIELGKVKIVDNIDEDEILKIIKETNNA